MVKLFRTPPKIWNKETKARMGERLRKLSRPKRDYSIPLKVKKAKPKRYHISAPKTINWKHLAKLSKPKKYAKCEVHQWSLTNALKNYTPTDRILKLSKPKKYALTVIKDETETYKVDPLALNYKSTPGFCQYYWKNLNNINFFFFQLLAEFEF